MIAILGEWIKHIVLLIFIATFLDLLLPNSSMQRYVKLVVGLLLIVIILSPVLQIFQFDYDRLLLTEEGWSEQGDSIFAERITAGKERIEMWQNKAILEEVAVVWAEEMKEEIVEKFGLKVHELQLNLSSQHEEVIVEQLTLELELIKEQTTESQKDNPPITIEPIRPVVIDVKPITDEEQKEENTLPQEKKIEQEVLTYLSKEWNISVDKMTCTWISPVVKCQAQKNKELEISFSFRKK